MGLVEAAAHCGAVDRSVQPYEPEAVPSDRYGTQSDEEVLAVWSKV